MKINTRAFTISFTVIFAVIILIITIWSRASTQFGHEFIDAFNSVHPHPFRATLSGLEVQEHIYGALLDLFYAVIDSILFSLSFCLIYNYIVGRGAEDNSDEA